MSNDISSMHTKDLDTKSCWKDRSPFTSEDNEEAMLKAFELFAMCMSAGPCNNCVFFKLDYEYNCLIGCPNTWPLFDVSSENTYRNRKTVLDALKRKENEDD